MRRCATTLCACLAALPAAAALAAPAAKVSAPRSGTYRGDNGHLTLFVNRRSIDLASFRFRCKRTTGQTNLNGIRVKRTRRGYSFAIKASGSVTYANGHPDQNGKLEFRGRFSRTGRSARGVLRARTSYCGDSGSVAWSARR